MKTIKLILLISTFLLSLPFQVNAQVVGKDCTRTSVGFKPLIDMGASEYYPSAGHASREEGGLYGNGSNSVPSTHYQKAVTATSQIKPLNASGQVDEANGKIGIVSLGMSNTTQVFSKFKEIADVGGSGKSSKVVLVDGAYNSQTAGRWAANRGTFEFDPWTNMENMISAAGLTKAQVQVFWIKLTNADPAQPGREDHPIFAEDLEADTSIIVDRLNDVSNGSYSYYPNVKIIYISSRTYGGYTLTNLSPEPSAYETGFAMRYLIDDQQGLYTPMHPDQIRNWVDVTYDNTPVILWSAYLWTDGTIPRSDGFTWNCEDVEFDGVHPSATSGRLKAASLLLNFFKTDPLAKTWFTGSGVIPTTTPGGSTPTPSITRTPAPSPTTMPTATPTIRSGNPADGNGDGLINGIDYAIWFNHYNQSVAGKQNGDYDGNGTVQINDYVVWINNYIR